MDSRKEAMDSVKEIFPGTQFAQDRAQTEQERLLEGKVEGWDYQLVPQTYVAANLCRSDVQVLQES